MNIKTWTLLPLIGGLSLAQASTLSQDMDVYGGKAPKAFTSQGITYTTPALQGIEKNHLSVQDIEVILKAQPSNQFHSFIQKNNIFILIRKNAENNTEVASVWKE